MAPNPGRSTANQPPWASGQGRPQEEEEHRGTSRGAEAALAQFFFFWPPRGHTTVGNTHSGPAADEVRDRGQMPHALVDRVELTKCGNLIFVSEARPGWTPVPHGTPGP